MGVVQFPLMGQDVMQLQQRVRRVPPCVGAEVQVWVAETCKVSGGVWDMQPLAEPAELLAGKIIRYDVLHSWQMPCLWLHVLETGGETKQNVKGIQEGISEL